MCGIAGFVGENQELIDAMTQALHHRGPDGTQTWVGNGGSLGHARLAILDPRPDANQPMWNDAKTVVMVYNGEIFNFRELRKKYNFHCKTESDTEVLLKMYDMMGMEMVHELRGMFALGLYDLERDSWHLARDLSGIKPLYVAYPDGNLHFASEMRSLLKAFSHKPAINTKALSQYVRLQYVPGPETLCAGVESLPPGTILHWQRGNENRITMRDHVGHRVTSPEEFKQIFPTVMDDSVKAHLVSDKPVGVFLSGGMDSSIVLHHMSNHAQKPIKTFTVRFDATIEEGAERFNTDADLAAKTAQHYGTDHTEILLTAETYRDMYKETAEALDQPNADSVSVAQALLAREAKKHVDVVLTGAGGDELFGGYPRYRVARILQLLRFMPKGLRGFGAMLTGQPADVLKMSPGAALAERLLSQPTKEWEDVSKGGWFKPHATTELFADRFAHIKDPTSLKAFMEFDRNLWLVDESLRLTDATTMHSGLEARVPFVDREIIGLAHYTNPLWHVTPGNTKALLKETYRSILPEHLFTLKKASFYPPLAKWIRREAAPLVEHMLAHKRIAEYFDIEKLRDRFERHKNGEYHLHTLSTLIQLSYWFDTVYDA